MSVIHCPSSHIVVLKQIVSVLRGPQTVPGWKRPLGRARNACQLQQVEADIDMMTRSWSCEMTTSGQLVSCPALTQ